MITSAFARKNLIPAIVAILFSFSAMATPALAGPFEDAVAAFNHGDNATGLRLMRELADQGSATAQSSLGHRYASALGVPKDLPEAVKWFRKAADQGIADAQLNLATLYLTGMRVPLDLTEAAKWYRKAGDQGNAAAQNFLGLMYYDGLGVSQDYTEAVKWYRKAADQGFASAQSQYHLEIGRAHV